MKKKKNGNDLYTAFMDHLADEIAHLMRHVWDDAFEAGFRNGIEYQKDLLKKNIRKKNASKSRDAR